MKLFDDSKKINMRHEDKYICSLRQLEFIENRIKGFIGNDEHQNEDGYNIRSMYLDTENDRLLEESLSGTSPRRKYRIRMYNCDSSRISLEEKTSINQLKSKKSCLVGYDYVYDMINNGALVEEVLEYSGMTKSQADLLEQVHALRGVEGLKPIIIVDYHRSAYVYNTGNIRITFDTKIGASTQIQDFFDESIITVPILPEKKGLIEVKYDGILPGFIARLLDMGSMDHVSFSKYALCRNVIENNGRREEYYVI